MVATATGPAESSLQFRDARIALGDRLLEPGPGRSMGGGFLVEPGPGLGLVELGLGLVELGLGFVESGLGLVEPGLRRPAGRNFCTTRSRISSWAGRSSPLSGLRNRSRPSSSCRNSSPSASLCRLSPPSNGARLGNGR